MYIVQLSHPRSPPFPIFAVYMAKSCPTIWRYLFQTKIHLKILTYFFLNDFDDNDS